MTSGTFNNLFAIFFVDDSTGWSCGASGSILHTTNGGETWEPQTSGTANALYDITFLNKQVGWAVGYQGIILKTSNGGAEWNVVPINRFRTHHAITFTDEQHGWVVGDGGSLGWVYHTSDGGLTWQDQIVDASYVYNDVYMHNDERGVIVGQQGRCFMTVNGGRPAASSPSSVPWGPLYVPIKPILHQNYPNPFNASTQIRFELPHRGHVKIEIFDLLGQRVEVLMDRELSGGEHIVPWNTRASSGVYFCRLAFMGVGAPETHAHVDLRLVLLR